MSFQPIILGNGLPAWSLLNRTLSTQQEMHSKNQIIQSDTRYFSENFASMKTADDIVSDRRILRVILGAYGLSDDIENKFFIKKIMNEGSTEPTAFANKLSDQRYRSLASDFDFSTKSPNLGTRSELMSQTIERFQRQAFEEAVGASSNDMRLGLTFQRTLSELVQSTNTNSAAWYQLMATPPLREVMQKALGFPQEFANLEIDDQFRRFQDKSESVFGSSDLSEMSEQRLSDEIIRRFLILQQTSQVPSVNSFKTALLLLSGSAQ